jgi:NADH-quinone oxidoreductase subunit L
MFLACGVGAFGAGIFHLMTHAFFKALLFLGAGSVIHGLSGEQDMNLMGGLRKHMPITFATMFIACIAISGIPPFSGFFSKDEILYQAFLSGNLVLWGIGLLTAFLTAFYMFRLLFRTFFGQERLTHEAKHHLHESPSSMTVPLTILATLSILGGFVGMPLVRHGQRLEEWLEPSLGGIGEATGHAVHASASVELTHMIVSVVVAILGITLAWVMYVRSPGLPEKVGASVKALYTGAYHKWYVDELYDRVIVRPLMGFSQFLWRIWDTWVIDGLVNLVGATVSGTGALLRLFQTGYVGTYAFWLVIGVLALLGSVAWGARL